MSPHVPPPMPATSAAPAAPGAARLIASGEGRAPAGTLARRAGGALAWKALQLAGVKAIFLIRTLVLARLLAPDDFGLLAIATVAVGVLMSVTELGMTQALVHRPVVDERHYDAAWTVNLLRAAAVSAALWIAASFVADLFAEPRAAAILRVLALKPVLDAAGSATVPELMRTLAYRRLAAIGLVAAGCDTVVSIALAARFGVWALVAGALTGAIAGVGVSYTAAPHRPRLLWSTASIEPLVRYGRWLFLTSLVSVAAGSLTQLVVSRRLGAVELGLYFLAAKLAFLPHEVASQVGGDVAFSVYASLQSDHARVTRAFRSILVAAATVLVPAYALLIVLAPRLVVNVLGARWAGTEPIIQLLAIVGIVGLFGDTTGPLFRGLGRPQWILWIEVWQSSVVIALLWTLTARFGVVGAALAWLAATCSSQVLSLALSHRVLRRPLAGLARPLGSIALASLSGALAATAVLSLSAGIGSVAAAILAGAAAIAIVLWLCDVSFSLSLRADLAGAFPQVAALLRLAPAARYTS